jgi:hypothetical protein
MKGKADNEDTHREKALPPLWLRLVSSAYLNLGTRALQGLQRPL